MTDKIQGDFQFEGAHIADKDLGNTPEGRSILASKPGAVILDTYEREASLKSENVRDSLTGIYNRRYFDQQLEARLKSGKKLSLAMVDLDYFGDFNNKFGHVTGDRLLIENARTLSNYLRLARPNGSRDFIARYGGDEIAIVLADIEDIEVAKKIIDNLRLRISDSEFKVDNKTSVPQSVSIGIALSRENDTPEDLIRRADRGLYLAKEKGRNRVEISPD